MLTECLNYLKGKLLSVMNESTPYFTRLAELKISAASRVCAAIPDADVVTFSGANAFNLDTKTNDIKRLDRVITVGVVLGERNTEALEPLFEAFLASLDESFIYAGHAIGITLGEAGWMDEKDSLIKAKLAVEIPIIFTGGIYRPKRYGKIETINIERES